MFGESVLDGLSVTHVPNHLVRVSAGIHGGLVDLSGDNPSKNRIVYSSVFIGGAGRRRTVLSRICGRRGCFRGRVHRMVLTGVRDDGLALRGRRRRFLLCFCGNKVNYNFLLRFLCHLWVISQFFFRTALAGNPAVCMLPGTPHSIRGIRPFLLDGVRRWLVRQKGGFCVRPTNQQTARMAMQEIERAVTRKPLDFKNFFM